MIMKNKILFVILFTTFLISTLTTPITADKTDTVNIDPKKEYEISEIIDADTIKIKVDDKIQTINLLLVDAPELKINGKEIVMGKNAKEFVAKFLKDKKIQLEFDKLTKDKDNIKLAYIYVKDDKGNKICINEKLIKNGYAKLVKYDTKIKKYEDYKKLETTARESKINIWENIQESFPKNTKNQKQQSPIGQGTIKGNRKSKIYHSPGQRDYDKISAKNTVYFETEEQAKQAGYRPASR